MQVDPIRPTLKAPGSKRLKLKHDGLLSYFAFKFNMRRHIMGWFPISTTAGAVALQCMLVGCDWLGHYRMVRPK